MNSALAAYRKGDDTKPTGKAKSAHVKIGSGRRFAALAESLRGKVKRG